MEGRLFSTAEGSESRISLLANARILRYLEKRHPDFLDQLQKVIAEMSAEGKTDGMVPVPAETSEAT